ncbi:MAG: hypothetical protein A2516_09900 [Alphaproteobacteria bacterium RIFOXYD12_FULL_60_8]|nr:MAG: hypothetical protein A2516_09900 [Alphaproteobacteria bacterium RIFOXYD12_FULL_60_8]
MAATDAITGTASLDAGSTSKAGSASTKLAKDMDTFLTLLTTQLKYQDPLSPMDSTEFTNQLVQFSSVEQQIAANKNLETLISMQNSNSQAQAVNYLNTKVEAESTQVPVQGGTAEFSYALTGEASEVTVAVTDQSGRVVFSLIGETSAGKHVVQWDGTDPYGAKVADGTYNILVTAMAGQTGESVNTKTTAVGKVTGVSTADGVTKLSMGDIEVALDKVFAVRS